MKFLVLFAVVAAASAQLVQYPNGAVAPVKTPEVQAAEAAHFAAKGAFAYAGHPLAYSQGYNGIYDGAYAQGYAGYNNLHAGAYAGAYATPFAYNNLAYAGAYGAYPYAQALQAFPNGAVVPVDEPAVQQARAEHFAAKGLAVGAPLGYAPYAANFAYHGLVAHPNGALVPAEPLDVVAARAEHLSHF
jgi:hypothetical protein